jgi:hypothetical protein
VIAKIVRAFFKCGEGYRAAKLASPISVNKPGQQPVSMPDIAPAAALPFSAIASEICHEKRCLSGEEGGTAAPLRIAEQRK